MSGDVAQTSGVVLADAAMIKEAAGVIKRGGLVAFPTETVYGLGADATNTHAVATLFQVKGRPKFDPLIVHVASKEEACGLWAHCPDMTHRLMEAFWPGPLTLVLPKNERIPDLVTAGLSTVAVRMPDHPVALELIRQAGCPIAAPSANRFGGVSPTTAQAVEEDLRTRLDVILDAGPARIGIESTVVACERDTLVVLRPGGIPVEAIREVAGTVTVAHTNPAQPAAPGMLARHYAPRTPLYLLDGLTNPRVRLGPVGMTTGRMGLLSFGPVIEPSGFTITEVLSHQGDLVEAAARLFQAIRRLDAEGLEAMVATQTPEHGLGLAIMDRLRKASQGIALVAEGRLVLIDRSTP